MTNPINKPNPADINRPENHDEPANSKWLEIANQIARASRNVFDEK